MRTREYYRKWRWIRGFGERLAVEALNSAVKREFGESLASKRDDSLAAEAIRKFWVYDPPKSYGMGGPRILEIANSQ